MSEPTETRSGSGEPPWRARAGLALSEVRGSIRVPPAEAGFWRQWRAFVGPALLVSVGYMDPGNWGTDLQAGASYQYDLLWVVLASSMMAIVLQVCSARLGIVTGRDLAQACRDHYPEWTRLPNWIATELAIIATDLAEVLGSAVAINLLFDIPLGWAVIITAFDVLLLLSLQSFGMRVIEAVVLVLIVTIATCFYIEMFILPQIGPDFAAMGHALAVPGLRDSAMVYIAIGIIGATVMPHNLYLHSALVQSRGIRPDGPSLRRALRFNTIDSVFALSIAFLINAAILVMAAVVFFGKDGAVVDGSFVAFSADSDWIRVAYLTLAPLLGTALASVLFAVALLASGQSSTITGTLAGQVVMEGFMRWRLAPWIRRLATRLLAIIPAVVMITLRGQGSVTELLTLSQVVLALQLPFAMIPLMHLTSSRRVMGSYANGAFLRTAGWGCVVLITAMDIYGLPETLRVVKVIVWGG